MASYVKAEGGYILMEDGSQIPISRQKREEVIKRYPIVENKIELAE